MRYSLCTAALILTGIPLILAAPQAAADNVTPNTGVVGVAQPVDTPDVNPIAPALVDSIKSTQTYTSGNLTSTIDGTLLAISPGSRLQGSTGLSWNNASVSGSWSFDTRASGAFSGGWNTDGKTYQHTGGVAINNGTGAIKLDSKISVSTNGSIEVELDSAYALRCETTLANPDVIGNNSPSKTICRAYAPNGMPSRRAEALQARATPLPVA